MTNFELVLPKPQSDLANQILKDLYNFSFLSLSREVQERELEKGLVDHIRDFLLELGIGFSFLGRQYPIEVSGSVVEGGRVRAGIFWEDGVLCIGSR